MDKNQLPEGPWEPLWQMLAAMDRDIAALYEDAGIAGLRSRFVGPLIRLARQGSMSIRELATAQDVTHSAMSQTVAAMRAAGFVTSADGDDGRTRRIELTARIREAVPLLEAEWTATQAVVRELEAEIPYALTKVVDDINEALARRPFRRRLDDQVARSAAERVR